MTAHARWSDPITSHEAAASLSGDTLRQSQLAVWDALNSWGPMTQPELIQRYMASDLPQQSPSGLRTRCSELVAKGMAEDTGEKQVLPSGRRSIIWRAR